MMRTAPATTPVATPAIVPFDICCASVGGAAVVVAAVVEDVLLARVDVDSVVGIDDGIVVVVDVRVRVCDAVLVLVVNV